MAGTNYSMPPNYTDAVGLWDVENALIAGGIAAGVAGAILLTGGTAGVVIVGVAVSGKTLIVGGAAVAGTIGFIGGGFTNSRTNAIAFGFYVGCAVGFPLKLMAKPVKGPPVRGPVRRVKKAPKDVDQWLDWMRRKGHDPFDGP